MASNEAKNNNKAKPATKPLRVPPEERFWQRYSPHFEFPLSICSSTFLHAITLVGLAVLPLLLGLIFKLDSSPPPFDTIVIAGGGGNPEGVGKGPPDGVLPSGKENVQQEEIKDPVSQLPKDKLDLQKARQNQLDLKLKESARSRPVDPASTPVSRQLKDAGNKARKELEGLLASKGKGGSGSGGGQGIGTGTGKGPFTGPGNNTLSQREKRKSRWVMIFNTTSGEDYLQQLRGLGAILAIRPDPNGPYLVIRDLSERPAHPKAEDLSQLDRIYWIDDKPESVRSLSQALGLDPQPPVIVAFFPRSVEEELLKKELAELGSSNEDEIEVTYFKVRRNGNRYEVVVTNQQRKRR